MIVLIDDVGFAASSAFGGPCNTPVAERLAGNGLKLNRFHTTALCSPTRQALLTGRNHHSVGMGAITEMATSAPGNSSIRPKDKAPIAETLRLNGYSTAQFGKCHEVPVWEVSPAGPFHQWPTGSGFEYFYGFIGGEANQYYPGLYEGTTAVEPPRTPEEGYTLTEDLADHAITWVRQQKALMPDKPFFMYFAPGATHAPHHVPQEWSDKYRGKFDEGWDVLREKIFDRQKKLGVIPDDAELTARHDEIPAWDDMSDELKPVLARQMEIYAGFLEQTDHEVGRVIDAHRRSRGARGHADLLHHRRQRRIRRGHAQRLLQRDDGPQRDGAASRPPSSCCPRSTTSAPRTPTTTTRSAGRMPCARRTSGPSRWPRTGAAPATAPSCTGPAACPTRAAPATSSTMSSTSPPRSWRRRVSRRRWRQRDCAGTAGGVSMLATLRDAAAPESHVVQYFEIMGNRGIYHKGWTASTKHRTPWKADTPPPFDDDVWELYGPDDWTQARNLVADNPEKLAELQRLWLIEAVKYNVVPAR